METGRISESLEITMEMTSDGEHFKSKSSTKHHPKNSTERTESENTQVYKNLITLLWQNDPPKMEYKVVIVEIFTFVCFVAIIIASFITQELKQQLLLGLNPWKWILLLGSVFCGLSMFRLGTFIILQYLIVPIFKLNKNVLFFASGLKTSVDILLWLGLILTFWLTWFRRGIIKHNQTSDVLHYVTRTLIALVLGAFFWILKNTLLLKLETDLHLNRFFHRIRYGVLHLLGIHMIHNDGEWPFEVQKGKEREILFENVNSMKEGAPTWLLKRLADLFGKSMEKLPLPYVPYESCDDDKLINVAVNQLLPKVVRVPRDHRDKQDKCVPLTGDDLKNGAGLTEKEAEVLFDLLEVFEYRKFPVNIKTFITWVTHAYRTCWSLRRCLNNSRGAINQLNTMLTSFLVIVMIVIWLLLTEIASQSTLALAFSPFLAATFMFGDTCKAMFQGIIFAFVMHPFEVGDRCVIDGQQMKVNRINILTTELCKNDGEAVRYPNSVLATKDIINFYASRNQGDTLRFDVNGISQLEAIEGLKTKIESYLRKSYHLCSEVEVLWEDFGKIAVHFKYVVSYPDSKERARLKSELISNINMFLQELKVEVTP